MAKKGRIIVVMLNEPFPFGHGNGRWAHALLKGLAMQGYDVRCLALATNPSWVRGAQDILAGTSVALSFYRPDHDRRHWLTRKLRTLAQPFSHLLPEALMSALDTEASKGYDVLQLEPQWAGYLAAGRDRALTSIHNLEFLDLSGIWHPSWSFLSSKLLRTRAEKRLLSRLRHVRATTERLAGAITRHNPAASVHTVPLALDPSLFEFTDGDRSADNVVGFLATMTWTPGYLAAVQMITKVFPKIRARCSHARLLLVGWHARLALAPYLGNPDVQIIENVPEAKPYFLKLQVFAYPLPQSSGIKVKLLEAMAYGIPVVTTTEGIEGIRAEDGVHAFVADDDDAFAERVAQLLSDRDLRRRLRRNARQLIEEVYSPQPATIALEKAYQNLS